MAYAITFLTNLSQSVDPGQSQDRSSAELLMSDLAIALDIDLIVQSHDGAWKPEENS